MVHAVARLWVDRRVETGRFFEGFGVVVVHPQATEIHRRARNFLTGLGHRWHFLRCTRRSMSPLRLMAIIIRHIGAAYGAQTFGPLGSPGRQTASVVITTTYRRSAESRQRGAACGSLPDTECSVGLTRGSEANAEVRPTRP